MHASRLGTLPGEFCKYFSVSRLHDWPDIRTEVRVTTVVALLLAAVAVVAVAVSVVVGATVLVASGFVNDTAPATALVLAHAVLTWLQKLVL